MVLLKDVKNRGKWYLVLSENSCQTDVMREFNLYLKLSESSVQTVLIREHCQILLQT